ncbi:hypothetical protein M1563_04180 [Patescibacteria group bacterium]|nr:hypothetical protein [Patescibacteria group bacterium]
MPEHPFIEYLSYEPREDLQKFATVPTEAWRQIGEQKVLENFALVVRAVPAYRDFLAQNGIKPERITSIEGFANLPLTTKQNYFGAYPLKDLMMGGDFRKATVIHSSSGSTGRPFFWPKTITQDVATYRGCELQLVNYFDIDRINTLYINCYAMGSWPAGEMVHTSTKMMAQKGLPITIISPGTNSKVFFDAFTTLAGEFEQVIIGGYPSFLRDIVQEGEDRGVDFKQHKINLLVGGEGHSENWRRYMTRHLGFSKPHRSIAAVLGMSEVGMASMSTPFADYLRTYLNENEEYAHSILGEGDLPTITQYIPMARHIEIVNGDIVISSMGSVPLIRYDTKDYGQILNPQDVLTQLPPSFKDHFEEMEGLSGFCKLPILTIDGRADKTIILFGANIYPDQIVHATESDGVEEYLTGKFIAEKAETPDSDTFLSIRFELRNGFEPSSELEERIREQVVQHLLKVNAEYANVIKTTGPKARPRVELIRHGGDNFVSAAGKASTIKS